MRILKYGNDYAYQMASKKKAVEEKRPETVETKAEEEAPRSEDVIEVHDEVKDVNDVTDTVPDGGEGDMAVSEGESQGNLPAMQGRKKKQRQGNFKAKKEEGEAPEENTLL